jgi:hypothetical protein
MFLLQFYYQLLVVFVAFFCRAVAILNNSRTALLIVGQARTFSACEQSLRHYVLSEVAPVDVFFAVQIVRESPADEHAMQRMLAMRETRILVVEVLNPSYFKSLDANETPSSRLKNKNVTRMAVRGSEIPDHVLVFEKGIDNKFVNSTLKYPNRMSRTELVSFRAKRTFERIPAHSAKFGINYTFAIRTRPDLVYGLPIKSTDLVRLSRRATAATVNGEFLAVEEENPGLSYTQLMGEKGDILMDDFLLVGTFESMRLWHTGKESFSPKGWALHAKSLGVHQPSNSEVSLSIDFFSSSFVSL